MAKLRALFTRKPAPARPRPIARSLRHLSAGERLDLSLRMGYFAPEVWAWGY